LWRLFVCSVLGARRLRAWRFLTLRLLLRLRRIRSGNATLKKRERMLFKKKNAETPMSERSKKQ
jgi:hypothetical protein